MAQIRRLVGGIWQWRWPIALNGFLLSPLFLYELRIGSGGPDKTLLFILPASVLWLLVVHLTARRVALSHVVLAPFYFFVAVDLYLIERYQTRLSSSTLLVITENLGDTGEYLKSHAGSVFGALGLLVAFYLLALRGCRNLHIHLPRKSAAFAFCGLAALYGSVTRQVGGFVHLATQDRSSPFGVISQSYVAYLVYRDSLREAAKAKSFVFGAKRPEANTTAPETYVLVVGESSRRDHWGVYGYPRDTTPELSRTENVIFFRNVLSQAALTQVSVPLIITRGNIVNPRRTVGERSIVSAFREVGFRTYWLSTQQMDPWTGDINRYSAEADTQRFFERRHDGVLVDALEEALRENPKTDSKVFIVIHTMGSHFTYTSRYPKEFSKFDAGDPKASSREQLVNAYDDTVLYTDHVLASVIGVLRKRAGTTALVYLSDHGENLRDDSRNLFGHFLSNEYDVPIPMFFWYSPEFAARHPDKIAAATSNAQRPINTRSAFYSLVDLAGIQLDDPEVKHLSVLSSDLKDVPRMVGAQNGVFDFDRFFEQNGKATRPQPVSGGPRI